MSYFDIQLYGLLQGKILSNVYEDRFVVFLDILGFSSLIERSEDSPDLGQDILDVLISMQPGEITRFSGSSINYDRVPDSERSEVEAIVARMNDIHLSQTNISVSYFSDCLVLSALKDDIFSRQMIIEALRNFAVVLWNSKKMLIRGGVCEGKLHHSPYGPVFGPALNRAYEIESREAVYPRILIDPECLISLKEDETLKLYGRLFQFENGRAYLSLASSLAFSACESMAAIQNVQIARDHWSWLNQLPMDLELIVNEYDDSKIREKYLWLKQESETLIEMKRPMDLLGMDK